MLRDMTYLGKLRYDLMDIEWSRRSLGSLCSLAKLNLRWFIITLVLAKLFRCSIAFEPSGANHLTSQPAQGNIALMNLGSKLLWHCLTDRIPDLASYFKLRLFHLHHQGYSKNRWIQAQVRQILNSERKISYRPEINSQLRFRFIICASSPFRTSCSASLPCTFRGVNILIITQV